MRPMNTNPIRVVLAEDHELVRAGICSLLMVEDGIEVVAQACDGNEALRLIRELQPDIALLDVKMAGLNGLETAERVTQEWPGVRVIMLSLYADEEYVLRAIRCGASGYLLKEASPTELVTAIRTVAGGDLYLSQSVSKHVIADYSRQMSTQDHATNRASANQAGNQLTRRQLEILQLIAQGLTTQQIAEKLFISPKTVETHRLKVLERLGLQTVADLVRYALRHGLVSFDD